MMWWGHHDVSGWGYALMGLSMALFWILVIAAIVFAVRYGSQAAVQAPTLPLDAEEQLALRYARGEIDAEEYRSRQENLRSRHGRPVSG